MPKRVSLPSMLPPGCTALATWSMPCFAMSGLPCCSLWNAVITSGTNRISMAASTTQPCRVSPTILPNV